MSSTAGRPPVDPPSGEVPDTQLGLVLEGAVARDLYRRMKGRPVRDACLDDGARSKTRGPLRCTELANRPGCHCVCAIDLDTLLIVGDGAC